MHNKQIIIPQKMIKQTLFFSQPYHLSTRLNQLIIQNKKTQDEHYRPIEDIGFVIFEHPQISVTIPLIQKMVANNTTIIYCDEKFLPAAMLLPLSGNTIQGERFRLQTELSIPKKKNLWKQVVISKIHNQALLLEKHGQNAQPLHRWKKEVKSGDTENVEAKAARYYWQHIFLPYLENFSRDRYGYPPNNLLNYGYAILRAAVARALVSSGLLCTLGIHHHNRYNAFCLADDIMEPYRPFIDDIVIEIITNQLPPDELEKAHKARLLKILTEDTKSSKGLSPLMISLSKSSSSLVKAMSDPKIKIFYPEIHI